MTAEERANDTLHIFRDEAGQWRWHRTAANGRIIAASGEGYEHRTDAVAIANDVNGGLDVVLDD